MLLLPLLLLLLLLLLVKLHSVRAIIAGEIGKVIDEVMGVVYDLERVLQIAQRIGYDASADLRHSDASYAETSARTREYGV